MHPLIKTTLRRYTGTVHRLGDSNRFEYDHDYWQHLSRGTVTEQSGLPQ